jgi:hypothetical protein
MSFCDRCGKQVLADALFCRNCGRRFQAETAPAQAPVIHHDKEVAPSTIKKPLGTSSIQVGLEKAEATKPREGREGVPASLAIVGAIAFPIGTFMLLMLSTIGLSSWGLLIYSYGIAVAIGVFVLILYPIVSRVRKLPTVRANR